MSSENKIGVENALLGGDIAHVSTKLSDDFSTLTCLMCDKSGENVTFETALPTGPRVRAIRQTIEILHNDNSEQRAQRAHALQAFADQLIKRLVRLQERSQDGEVQQKCDCLIQCIKDSVAHKCPYSQLKEFVCEIDNLEQPSFQKKQKLKDSGLETQMWQAEATTFDHDRDLFASQDVQLKSFQELARLVQDQLRGLVQIVGLDDQSSETDVTEVAVNRTMLSIQQLLGEQPSPQHLRVLVDCLDQMQVCISNGDEQGLIQTVIDTNKFIQDATINN